MYLNLRIICLPENDIPNDQKFMTDIMYTHHVNRRAIAFDNLDIMDIQTDYLPPIQTLIHRTVRNYLGIQFNAALHL